MIKNTIFPSDWGRGNEESSEGDRWNVFVSWFGLKVESSKCSSTTGIRGALNGLEGRSSSISASSSEESGIGRLGDHA